MFLSPPRLILTALVVGGVTHDPIKARCQLEQARAASAIAVARRRSIHRRRCRRRHRRRHCRHRRRSSLLSPLQNVAVAFSASSIATAAATAAIAVAAATTIAANAAVVDCCVFVTPTTPQELTTYSKPSASLRSQIWYNAPGRQR